jgi:hypothetical protein
MSIMSCKCGSVLQSRPRRGPQTGYYYDWTCPHEGDSAQAMGHTPPFADKRVSVYQAGTAKQLLAQAVGWNIKACRRGRPGEPFSRRRIRTRIVRRVKRKGFADVQDRDATRRLEGLYRQLAQKKPRSHAQSIT